MNTPRARRLGTPCANAWARSDAGTDVLGWVQRAGLIGAYVRLSGAQQEGGVACEMPRRLRCLRSSFMWRTYIGDGQIYVAMRAG